MNLQSDSKWIIQHVVFFSLLCFRFNTQCVKTQCNMVLVFITISIVISGTSPNVLTRQLNSMNKTHEQTNGNVSDNFICCVLHGFSVGRPASIQRNSTFQLDFYIFFYHLHLFSRMGFFLRFSEFRIRHIRLVETVIQSKRTLSVCQRWRTNYELKCAIKMEFDSVILCELCDLR